MIKFYPRLVCFGLIVFVFACEQSPSILLTEKPVDPAPNKIDWTIYNNSNSALPRTWVNCIAFDVTETVVWAGLYHNGLARFDGARWQVFTKNNSGLPSDSVLSLAVDAGNNLWVGTVRGLAKYDGKQWTIFNVQNSPLPANKISALAVDQSGILWIACQDTKTGSVAARDGESWKVYSAGNSDFIFNYPVKIIVDKNNTKWIGAQEYFAYGNYIRSALVKFDGINWQNIQPFAEQMISAMAFANTDKLWFATSSNPVYSPITYSIAIFDGASWVSLAGLDKTFPMIYIFDIKIDKQDRTWLASTFGVIRVESFEYE